MFWVVLFAAASGAFGLTLSLIFSNPPWVVAFCAFFTGTNVAFAFVEYSVICRSRLR